MNDLVNGLFILYFIDLLIVIKLFKCYIKEGKELIVKC